MAAETTFLYPRQLLLVRVIRMEGSFLPRGKLATRVEIARLRRYVARRHRQDTACQRQLGLDTFAEDWERLAAYPKPSHSPARNLWMLWLQGEAQAPALVRACIDTWRERNPSWSVRVLDAATMADLIDLPQFPRHISPTHKADIVRLRLLARYGGIWTDATTICQRPLDDWIHKAMSSGFFAFTRPQPLRSVANWFIAAQADSQLLNAWLTWSEIYILGRRRASSYFWQHHTFDWLLERHRTLRAQWIDTPKISARGPHVLQRLLDGHLETDAKPAAVDLASLPLFKLNRRKGYEIADVRKVFDRYGLQRPI